jgi:hypothetical protein
MKTWLLVLMSAVLLAVFGAIIAALLATPEGQLVAVVGLVLLIAPNLILSLHGRGEPHAH